MKSSGFIGFARLPCGFMPVSPRFHRFHTPATVSNVCYKTGARNRWQALYMGSLAPEPHSDQQWPPDCWYQKPSQPLSRDSVYTHCPKKPLRVAATRSSAAQRPEAVCRGGISWVRFTAQPCGLTEQTGLNSCIERSHK